MCIILADFPLLRTISPLGFLSRLYPKSSPSYHVHCHNLSASAAYWPPDLHACLAKFSSLPSSQCALSTAQIQLCHNCLKTFICNGGKIQTTHFGLQASLSHLPQWPHLPLFPLLLAFCLPLTQSLSLHPLEMVGPPVLVTGSFSSFRPRFKCHLLGEEFPNTVTSAAPPDSFSTQPPELPGTGLHSAMASIFCLSYHSWAVSSWRAGTNSVLVILISPGPGTVPDQRQALNTHLLIDWEWHSGLLARASSWEKGGHLPALNVLFSR